MTAPAGRGARSPAEASVPVAMDAVGDAGAQPRTDQVAVEEPMEIRVVARGSDGVERRHAVAVTMRTPGHDAELAAGFLLSEGVIAGPGDLARVAPCGDGDGAGRNVVNAYLAPGVEFDPARFTRNVYTTSSCGICGKASLELIRAVCPSPLSGGFRVAAEVLHRLPARCREAQGVFDRTGGLHAAALFDASGKLLLAREDVGRHNAFDKVVGALLLAGEIPASERVVLVSGRASFELVQKGLVAGIPVLAAVGAPTSLAVETAREFGMTLAGFLRDGRFNVYAGGERILRA